MANAIALSAPARTALRKAISSHADWPQYRRDNGNITTAEMSASRCLEVAARFGIDVPMVISAAAAIAAAAEKRAAASFAEKTGFNTEMANAGTAAADTQRTADAEKRVAAAVTTDVVKSAPMGTDKALTALRELLGSQAVDEDMVRDIVKTEIKSALEGTALVRIEVARTDGTTWKSEGHQHPLFEKLLRMISSRQQNGQTPNVWIAGPTGSGKTHAAEMVAHALGVPFYFNGALEGSHELLGFVSPTTGVYQSTPFREAYENGGLYLFDECDASDNSPLLKLNAALANGVCAFPDSTTPVKRHPDFRCIAAANTFGQGATAQFIGRAKIDDAFLSRFPGKIHWTYDVALEQAISGNVEWVKRVQAARARAQHAGLKTNIDPRHSQAGAAYIASGFSADETAEMTYLAGLSPDQIRIVEGR